MLDEKGSANYLFSLSYDQVNAEEKPRTLMIEKVKKTKYGSFFLVDIFKGIAAKIFIKCFPCSHVGGLFGLKQLLFKPDKHLFDLRIFIEAVSKVLVDGLEHPVFRLFLPLSIEVAVFFHEVDIPMHHVPHFGDAVTVVTGIGEHLGRPS